MGVNDFKIEKPSYGGCILSGNLKYNIEVPKNFSGYIYDPSATFTYRGNRKIMRFNDEYFEENQLEVYLFTDIYLAMKRIPMRDL